MYHNYFIFCTLVVILYLVLYSKQNTIYNTKYQDIRKLTRQCSRWLIAAQQDESPLIATLHIRYGMGYLWAIKDITTTNEFQNATGLNFLIFESRATKIQDKISKQIINACPQFAGDIDKYLAKVANIGNKWG